MIKTHKEKHKHTLNPIHSHPSTHKNTYSQKYLYTKTTNYSNTLKNTIMIILILILTNRKT